MATEATAGTADTDNVVPADEVDVTAVTTAVEEDAAIAAEAVTEESCVTSWFDADKVWT